MLVFRACVRAGCARTVAARACAVQVCSQPAPPALNPATHPHPTNELDTSYSLANPTLKTKQGRRLRRRNKNSVLV